MTIVVNFTLFPAVTECCLTALADCLGITFLPLLVLSIKLHLLYCNKIRQTKQEYGTNEADTHHLHMTIKYRYRVISQPKQRF